MDTFTLTIELGNAEMEDGGDIADALRAVALRLDSLGFEGDIVGMVRDINGNTVGRWELS